MKKQTFKNLQLQKKTISKITNHMIGGARYHTYTCNSNSVLMCPIEADTSDPLEPITVDSKVSCTTCVTDFFCN